MPVRVPPEALQRLATLLRAGNHPDVAAEAVGIRRDALRAMLAEGASQKAGKARELREEVIRALAEAEAGHVAVIARAARGDAEREIPPNWQAAAAWLLERRYSDRWARPSQREKGGDAPDDVATAALDPFAEVDELAARRRTT